MIASDHKRGGRPRKLDKRRRVNMTLPPEIHAEASRLAFIDGRSLSSYVAHCLQIEIDRAKATSRMEGHY